MAITINGAGTITGISAGGLPDGCVVADDLATDAVTTVKIDNGSVTDAKLASSLDLTSKTVTLPAGTGGKILQVVQVVKSDAYSATATNTWTDITGMSASITPSSTSNKVLVYSTFQVTCSGPYAALFVNLVRNSTALFLGDVAGSRSLGTLSLVDDVNQTNRIGVSTKNFLFLDSPASTSSVTYKLQHRDFNVDSTIYVNRSQDDTDDSSHPRTASNIILMEVAA